MSTRPGERESDDERRRHEEVRLDVLVHARLEIAVAGEHAGGDEIVLRDRFLERGMQRAGVADAGRAAVADGLEAELVEVGLEAGLVEIIGDDARAGRERGLHGGIDRQAVLHGFLREQTGGEHHARVAGVRAARDGGDQHAAVADFACRPGGIAKSEDRSCRASGDSGSFPPRFATGPLQGGLRLCRWKASDVSTARAGTIDVHRYSERHVARSLP